MSEHQIKPGLMPEPNATNTPLVALGGLLLPGQNFRREKPLLLATHLALEGPWSRRQLAERFYVGASDPMNSLAVALGKLRKLGLVESDWMYAWFTGQCDAVVLREHLAQGRCHDALGVYAGEFAHGIGETLGSDLEDWVLATRENLGREVREAALLLAERAAATGDFKRGAELALNAQRLPGAPLLEPEPMVRVYRLLLAGEHAACETLRQEANELGVALPTSAPAARGLLRRVMLGRARELEALQAMRVGDWAWVQGETSMGKTTLLRELAAHNNWIFLPARDGLPYATLEPLLPNVQQHEDALLFLLRRVEHDVLIDDAHLMDAASAALLARWRATRPNVRVVLAATTPPKMRVEVNLELRPLLPNDVQDHPGAFDYTRGLPALVGAWIRGEPLEHELSNQLRSLNEAARLVHAALCLAPSPDRDLVRRALGLTAQDFAAAFEDLLRLGLLEPSAQVRGIEAAQRALALQPEFQARVALLLARQVKSTQAAPLYRLARGLLTDHDQVRVARAHAEWAKALLQRGFPDQALETLEDAPTDNTLEVLRARALERSARYAQAAEILERCTGDEARALEAKVLWRLGKPNEAQHLAETLLAGSGGALGVSMEGRAEALNTLGHLAIAAGDTQSGLQHHKRALTLWNGLGEKILAAQSLNSIGMALILLGHNPADVLQQSRATAETDPTFEVYFLINTGMYHLKMAQHNEAETLFRQAIDKANAMHMNGVASIAWGNVGVILHLRNDKDAADHAYGLALGLAQAAGDRMQIGNIMANLAELHNNLEGWEEAANFLEASGWRYLAEGHREQMQAFRLRSGQARNTEPVP